MVHTPDDPTKAQVWVTKGLDDLDFEFYIPSGPKGDPGGFTTGTALGSQDLNAITTPGLYRQDNGNNATTLANYPVQFGAGSLEVVASNGPADLLQRYTPSAGAPTGSGRAQYVRRYFSGVWGAWYGHFTSRIDQTAGRVIYQWDDLNGREQLIFGDTGVRRVETLFINGWTAAIANLRRVGSVVQLGLYNVSPTAQSNAVAYNLPSGFRPAALGGNICIPTKEGSSWTQANVTGSGDLMPSLTALSCLGAIHLFTFTTTDTWPTSLPGIASGGIASM